MKNINLQKDNIFTFYKECFGIEVDWKDIIIPSAPTNLKRLELILNETDEDQIFEAYAKRFGRDNVHKYYESIFQIINRKAGGETFRPKTNYALLHKGGLEPDKEHLNKSYDVFDKEKDKSFMIVKEGMIAAFRQRFETGEMYDLKGLTRFHSLDFGGLAMDMSRFGYGGFCIAGFNRYFSYHDYGPRQCCL